MGMWNKQTRFTMLVEAYSSDLYRYAWWLCHNKETAEDLVQETFTRAWRSLDSLQDEKAAKYWLMTTLRRENARLYERKRPQAAAGVEPDSMPATDVGYDTSPEAHVLRQALAGLHEDYREPLLLQVIGGYSCDEIAGIMDISASAVMTRLFRARKKMQQVLLGDDRQEAEEYRV